MATGRGPARESDEGFTLIEVIIAMLILMMVMMSMTTVLINSMSETAYARQRSDATNLANETVEEIRSLQWNTLETGMSTSDILASGDTNIVANCFEGAPLDVASIVGAQSCADPSWVDPPCLSHTATSPPPAASALTGTVATGYAPISPHQACYLVGSQTYGVDVYITGVSNSSYLTGSNQPLTATVVVSWSRPFVHGVSDHVVTTTELSACLKGGAECSTT